MRSRQSNDTFHTAFKTALAGSLIVLMLAVHALALHPGHHKELHSDADAHAHSCAITLFAQGLLLHAVAVIAVLAMPLRFLFSVFPAPGTPASLRRLRLPPSCGPPLFPA